VVVSPDGRHVYVSGGNDNAIAIFQRDGASVSFQEVVKDGIGSVDLQGAGALAISPDGLRLFVVAASTDDPAPDEIVVFARNPATGSLRRAESRADGAAPEDLLALVNGVAVSPDGRSLYAVSYLDSGLTSYRWPDLLREVQIARDGEDGVEGLDSASYLAASPDGRSLYVAGFDDSAIAVFARDTRFGTVEFVEFERNGVGGVSSFDGPQGLTVSPDGKHVYATAGQSGAVAVFTRSAATGALTFLQSHRDGFGGVDGLAGATTVLVSPDGKHVYVGGYNDAAVALFTRNAATGALTFVSSVFDGQGGADGLEGAGGLGMAMDRAGRHLYVPGSNEAALTVFERDAATGALAHVQTLRDGVDAGLLDFPSAAAFSPDEGLLYVTSLLDDGLTTFARDAGLGVLDELELEIDGVAGVVDLEQPRGIAVAKGGERLYVATQMSDAIVAFDHDTELGSTTFAGSVVNSACLPALDSASDVVAMEHFVYAASYLSDALVVLAPEPAGTGVSALAVLLVIGTKRRSLHGRGGRC
jgi:6-phosphogluconolactonase (cycloisomerase 2 family)